jgi:hypothetical protein
MGILDVPPPVLERKLHVAITKRARAVSDNEGCASVHQLFERLDDRSFSAKIHRAGGLSIIRIGAQESSGERDTLTLPSGDCRPAITADCRQVVLR